MPQLSDKALIWIGSVTVAVVIFVFKWYLDNLKRSINDRQDRRDEQENAYRKERETDQIHIMRGQQVTCDCLHELIYAVLHGEHNGGLETVGTELENYRTENRDMLLKKAARWNININK